MAPTPSDERGRLRPGRLERDGAPGGRPTACARPASPTGGTAPSCTSPPSDEAPVENILDLVEGESDDEDGDDEPSRSTPTRDQVAYDLAEWDDDQARRAGRRARRGAGIAYALGRATSSTSTPTTRQAADELLRRVSHRRRAGAEADDGDGRRPSCWASCSWPPTGSARPRGPRGRHHRCCELSQRRRGLEPALRAWAGRVGAPRGAGRGAGRAAVRGHRSTTTRSRAGRATCAPPSARYV